jgi:hypothetical protein
MLSSGVILALSGTLLLAVADNVPSLNVEPACRAAAKMGDSLSLDTTLRQCLADEKSARDQLEKEWTQFTPALRQRCVATTQTGGDPSYVEVLVCLQIDRECIRLTKLCFPAGSGMRTRLAAARNPCR